MRRRAWACLALMFLAAVGGCSIQTATVGDAVFFEGPIHLYDEGVYFQGTKVGTIQSQEAGSGTVVRVLVSLSEDLKQAMGNNMAFYVDNGRLEVARLQGVGEPLKTGTPFCGFTSKSELNWFKFKTLLNDRIIRATQRALAMQAQFG